MYHNLLASINNCRGRDRCRGGEMALVAGLSNLQHSPSDVRGKQINLLCNGSVPVGLTIPSTHSPAICPLGSLTYPYSAGSLGPELLSELLRNFLFTAVVVVMSPEPATRKWRVRENNYSKLSWKWLEIKDVWRKCQRPVEGTVQLHLL